MAAHVNDAVRGAFAKVGVHQVVHRMRFAAGRRLEAFRRAIDAEAWRDAIASFEEDCADGRYVEPTCSGARHSGAREISAGHTRRPSAAGRLTCCTWQPRLNSGCGTS